jgi:hypothetical protein
MNCPNCNRDVRVLKHSAYFTDKVCDSCQVKEFRKHNKIKSNKGKKYNVMTSNKKNNNVFDLLIWEYSKDKCVEEKWCNNTEEHNYDESFDLSDYDDELLLDYPELESIIPKK